MNESWVKAHLEKLTRKIQDCKAVLLRISFEPTTYFYSWLSEGDENDLQFAGTEIANFLDLAFPPAIHYDWGIKMEPEVAGRIRHSCYIIQIPFAYVGKRFALGGIIAHEMTHAFLFEREIILEDPQENEAFTDLAAIFIGLGKLVINGCITASSGHQDLEILGYLPPDLLAFTYLEVCRLRSISEKIMAAHLTAEAMELIRESG